MAFPSAPLTVFVPKPSSLSFGEAMSRVRIWLDHTKIEPCGFKLAANFNRIGLEISFRNETEVTAFREFVWPPV